MPQSKSNIHKAQHPAQKPDKQPKSPEKELKPKRKPRLKTEAAPTLSEQPLAPAPPPLTSSQIRAARALLRWSADDLAAASYVAIATIRRAELSERETKLTRPNDLAIRRALEQRGVMFVDANENQNGEGVRWAKYQLTV